MTAAPKKQDHYTIAEYLELEEQALVKSEYERGQILAMSGGTVNHALIGANISTALSNAIREKGSNCYVLNSEARVFIEKAESFVYPDSLVICDQIQTAEKDENAIINPVLIIEVLSKSTGNYDRGDKFNKYRSLPSFKEYVLIDQYKPVVDVLYKESSSYWKMTTSIGLDKSIYLNTLECSINMSDIYQGAQNLDDPPPLV